MSIPVSWLIWSGSFSFPDAMALCSASDASQTAGKRKKLLQGGTGYTACTLSSYKKLSFINWPGNQLSSAARLGECKHWTHHRPDVDIPNEW